MLQRPDYFNNVALTPPIKLVRNLSKSVVPKNFHAQILDAYNPRTRIAKERQMTFVPSDRALLRVLLNNQQDITSLESRQAATIEQQQQPNQLQCYLDNFQTLKSQLAVSQDSHVYPKRVETSHKYIGWQDKFRLQARTQPHKALQIEVLESERPKSIMQKISTMSFKKSSQQDPCMTYRIRKILIDKSMLRLITAKSFVIMCEVSRMIVYSRKSRKQREIASLTKIMTCYIACQIIKHNELDAGTLKALVSKRASKITGTSALLRQGDELSLLDLLHGAMLPSGNDAAYALGEYFGRYIMHQESVSTSTTSMGQFLSEMNKYARELDMKNTQFWNAHGLANSDNHSSALDVAVLVQEAMKNELFVSVVGCPQYRCVVYNKNCGGGNRDTVWENTNKLLNRKECLGVKTGYTPVAGSCLAANFHFLNIRLIIVLLGSTGQEERFTEMIHLYEYTKRKLMI